MDAQLLKTLNDIEQAAYSLKGQLTPHGLANKAEVMLTLVNDIRRRLATESKGSDDKQVLLG